MKSQSLLRSADCGPSTVVLSKTRGPSHSGQYSFRPHSSNSSAQNRRIAVQNFNASSLATAAIGIVGASVFLTSSVQATPPVNWSGTPLVVANLNDIARTNDERIKFQTKDPTDTQV